MRRCRGPGVARTGSRLKPLLRLFFTEPQATIQRRNRDPAVAATFRKAQLPARCILRRALSLGSKQFRMRPLKVSMSKRADTSPTNITSTVPLTVSISILPPDRNAALYVMSPFTDSNLAREKAPCRTSTSPLTLPALISPLDPRPRHRRTRSPI